MRKNGSVNISRLWLPLAFLLLAMNSFGQAYRFVAKSNKSEVVAGTRFRLEFSLQGGRPESFEPPALENLRRMGPVMQGVQTQVINGNFSKYYTFSMDVVASEKGEYTIPPARVVVDGKELTSNELRIKVLDEQESNKNLYDQIAEGVFIKVHLSKKSVYVGEQLRLTYKLYKRIPLRGLQPSGKPDYSGFWKETISRVEDFEFKRETINGKLYETGILESVLLFPQRTGTIEINPFVLDTKVPVRTGRYSRDPFWDGFFGNERLVDYSITSPKVKIEVKELPRKGKPSNFSGLVGDFDLQTKLTDSAIAQDDPITLNITVSGKGNLKWLDPFDIGMSSGIEDYPVKIHDNLKMTSDGMKGSRRFEYYMIGRREGTYKIPPISFNYFDPAESRYREIEISDLMFQVGDGQSIVRGTKESGPSFYLGKEQVDYLEKDLRYIHTTVSLAEGGSELLDSALYYAGLSSPFLLLIALFFYRRQQEQGESVNQSRRKAKGKALKELSAAQKEQDPSQFQTVMLTAVYRYLSNMLQINLAEITEDKIKEAFGEAGLSEESKNACLGFIKELEFSRYAPSKTSNSRSNQIDSAVELIKRIDGELENK